MIFGWIMTYSVRLQSDINFAYLKKKREQTTNNFESSQRSDSKMVMVKIYIRSGIKMVSVEEIVKKKKKL